MYGKMITLGLKNKTEEHMKLNRSLAISTRIQECQKENIMGLLEKEFPTEILEPEEGENKGRNRVFTISNTLLAMVLTSIQQDKTLKNSVNLYYIIHQQTRQRVLEEMEQAMEKERERDELKERTVGRPRKYGVQLPKSLDKDISLNTAAYSRARDRVPLGLAQKLFQHSRIEGPENTYSHWHGRRVFLGDGTYIQMQDTDAIRKDYKVKHKGKDSEGYPQGLLVAITERGAGQVHDFELSNRHVSELPLLHKMLDGIPEKSLLLLDDLYNCYEIISRCHRGQIDFVVPAKRDRTYEHVETIEEGDEIIRIKTPKNRSKWLEEKEKPGSFLLRRITCQSPDGKQYVLLTSLLDRTISKHEIQELYLSRWDIEISIREIKTIMDINVLRSRTPEMALKELTVSLATYNLIRKTIYASIKDLPFSPEEDFIYQFYTVNKDVLIDKKGRVYNRWSTGRRRTGESIKKTDITKEKTKQKI